MPVNRKIDAGFFWMDYDAIIIGAGPVGSTIAETIGRGGHNVLVLEEHLEVGSPTHCTGKLSVNAFKELNLDPVGVLNEVKGATFYSPNMKSFQLERNDAQAYILNRRIFDEWLSDKAVKVGTVLLTDARAKEFSATPSGVNVILKHKGETKKIKSRVVVGADGASSTVARRTGLYSKKRSEVKIGVQKEVIGIRNLQTSFVELYFGRKYAPGFFAWIVPTGDECARVGLALSPNSSEFPSKCLEKFINTHPIAKEKLEGCSSNQENIHIIPTGGALRQTVSDGFVIVGDAAGQVKSTTGGGLYWGMLCAKIAGKTISKALEVSGKGVLRRESLSEYQRLWRERLNREMLFSVRARAFLDSLTDDEMNYLFEFITSNKSLLREVEAEGDVDWQSKLKPIAFNLKTLAKRPLILYKLGKTLLL